MYSGSHVYDVTRDLIATNFERCTTRNKHMWLNILAMCSHPANSIIFSDRIRMDSCAIESRLRHNFYLRSNSRYDRIPFNTKLLLSIYFIYVNYRILFICEFRLFFFLGLIEWYRTKKSWINKKKKWIIMLKYLFSTVCSSNGVILY